MTIRDNAAARAAFEKILIALDKLQAAGAGKVVAVWYSGQKPVVEIDAPPRFVKGGLLRRMGINAQLASTYAAPYHGVQLQWTVVTPMLHEAGHA